MCLDVIHAQQRRKMRAYHIPFRLSEHEIRLDKIIQSTNFDG